MQCHLCILVFRGGPAHEDGPQTHGSTVGGLMTSEPPWMTSVWSISGIRLAHDYAINRKQIHFRFSFHIGKEHSSYLFQREKRLGASQA